MTIHQASCTLPSRRARPFWAAAIGLALGFGLCALAPAAKAEIVSLSATGFVRHCPCVEDGTQESNTHDGVLEMTGQNVTECTGGSRGLSEEDLKRDYRSEVDPRLNSEQALEIAMLMARKMARM